MAGGGGEGGGAGNHVGQTVFTSTSLGPLQFPKLEILVSIFQTLHFKSKVYANKGLCQNSQFKARAVEEC